MPSREDPGARRMDSARLVPIEDPILLVRSAPDGDPADPWPEVREILDSARTALPDVEFAQVVRATRRVIMPLMHGRPAEWPPPGPSDGGGLADGATTAMRDVRATLCLAARHGGPGSSGALAMLGRRIGAHLDDLVAGREP